MKQLFNFAPKFTPWLLFIFFSHMLFIDIEFKIPISDKQPLEILVESNEIENSQESWTVKKGILLRLSDLQEIRSELDLKSIPLDGIPESTLERLSRIIFGQKLMIWSLLFLVMLCISSYISWVSNAWFSITLNKTLHWIGMYFTFAYFSKVSELIGLNLFASILAIYLIIQLIYLILSYKAINRQKKEKVAYEVLKHTAELDEEGKKPTSKIELKPLRLAYHFFIIFFVGLLIGNLFYIPLFLIQKHYSYEFGILLLALVFLLSIFYVRNYYNLSKDNFTSRWKGITTSISYLQYKFIKNIALGLGATILLILFVTVLFSILILNADALKNPSLGIIEKSAEF
jgi:hypothetical protein